MAEPTKDETVSTGDSPLIGAVADANVVEDDEDGPLVEGKGKFHDQPNEEG